VVLLLSAPVGCPAVAASSGSGSGSSRTSRSPCTPGGSTTQPSVPWWRSKSPEASCASPAAEVAAASSAATPERTSNPAVGRQMPALAEPNEASLFLTPKPRTRVLL